jgi:DNA-binding CsgD family transcriptional regulator/PAS domain-containing protein
MIDKMIGCFPDRFPRRGHMSPDAFSKTVASIFAAVVDDGQTSATLEAVAKFVGVSGVGCVMQNKFTGQISSAAWWGIFTGRPADYMSHYGKIDPSRAIWDRAAACGRLLRVSESLPRSFLRNDEWYIDWLLRGGVCDVLGTTLYESPSRKMSVGLYRAIGDVGPFPRAEEQLQALMPSLRNAARLHVGLIDAGYRSAIGRSSIDQLAAGAIFIDKDGRIIDTNWAGDKILLTGDGLTMRNGRVSARRSFETAKLARLIADAAAAEGSVPSAGCMLIARDDGRPPYVVRVAPVSGGLTGDDLPMAMLVVSTSDERRVSQGELAELYGPSPAESRIALALARGKRLTELAGEFGVQITTLRSQLSSTLTKCGVERQSDLVRLISTIPVVQPVRPETAPE